MHHSFPSMTSLAVTLQVPISEMDPVVLKSLCMHDYATGEPINDYDLSDYESKWKHPYLMFHRQDMHRTLLSTAIGQAGDGPPCKLFVNHRVQHGDAEAGRVSFTNGIEIVADLVVGADGIRVHQLYTYRKTYQSR